MFELEIGLADEGKLNFDKYFLHFNVRKKKICQELLENTNLNLAINTEY